MKRTEPQLISEVLRQALDNATYRGKLAQRRLIEAWPAVIGRHIASHTGGLTIRRGVLTVRVDAAPLRQELYMLRSALVEALNKAADADTDTITDIRFTSPAANQNHVMK